MAEYLETKWESHGIPRDALHKMTNKTRRQKMAKLKLQSRMTSRSIMDLTFQITFEFRLSSLEMKSFEAKIIKRRDANNKLSDISLSSTIDWYFDHG